MQLSLLIKKHWIILLLININARITYASYLDGVTEEVMPMVAVYQIAVVFYFVFNFIRNPLKSREVSVKVFDAFNSYKNSNKISL